MWLRMLTVVVEMEAKKEYAFILREIHKLHLHHHVSGETHEPAPTPVQKDATHR